jgi:glutamyl-tRNA synthetase
MNSVTTRFAPSPTGHLHVGNLRTAIHNWMWARKNGGRFLLRLDDTDAERSREEYADSIIADLAWLGMEPDAKVRQSERLAIYEAFFTQLRAAGWIYPCYETAQELDLKRKVALGRGLPPVYDRAALALKPQDMRAFEAEGRKPHWRFRLDHDQPIAWEDRVRGPQHFDPKLLSDPVIRREDGSWLYMLPSVLDDIEMGVTDVVRGEDHVSNTATQVQMFTALGAPAPHFAHAALLTGTEGKLSKRLGSVGISTFREEGIEPIALIALLARIGTSDPVEPFVESAPLIASFDFTRFGRAPARFDEQELAQINHKIIHMLSFAAVRDRLPAGMTEAAWNCIRANIETVEGARFWWAIVTGPIEPPALTDEDRGFAALAAETLEDLPFDECVWSALTSALKAATGRKGKGLFLPLRLALTGQEHGPDMAGMLAIVGKDEAIRRFKAAA